MILSLITYPLSPKIKPKHTIFSNVSKLPPPPPPTNTRFVSQGKQTKLQLIFNFFILLSAEIGYVK